MNVVSEVIIIGIGATLVMDAWSIVRRSLLGIPLPNYSMVGRWVGHMMHGQTQHKAIAASPFIRGEQFLGWAVHYLTGVAFAVLLVGLWGSRWLQDPSLAPAVAVGVATVAAPFFLMQPGMGAGIAASKTPRPGSARLQSVIAHTVFGFGLYLSALIVLLV